MNDALIVSGLRVGTIVAMLGGIGVFVLSRGWYERPSSALPEDVNPADHMVEPSLDMRRDVSVTMTWLMTFALTILFVAAGLPKLGSPTFMASQFEGWGYPETLRQVIGGIEVLGAIFLLIPRVAFWAACVLGAVMAGSIATHLAAGQFLMSLIPMAVLGVITYVAAKRRPQAYGLGS